MKNERALRTLLCRILCVAVIAWPLTATAAGEEDRTMHGEFTGEVKPVVYVEDVEAAAPFYRDVLGFELHDLVSLPGADDPYYAEMSAGELRFGLHEPMSAGQESRVGQLRLYFRVHDLESHHRRVTAWEGEPSEIFERSWMDYFIVTDPAGNEVVFAVTDPERHSIDPW